MADKENTGVIPLKKFLSVLLIICFILLSGCSAYYSKYNAVAFVHSNTSDNAFMSFYQFEGTMVFKLKNKSDAGVIKYTAKLEKGSAEVYCDDAGTKTLMCSVNSGQSVESASPPLKAGTVYIIVQSNGKCENGDFWFDLG
ncbi:MAG: hypothetical protein IKY00_07360 [Clostridia bacterium]|nr:hypothetical protein [Clostridia bacterium]